jgi:hypothetical protein
MYDAFADAESDDDAVRLRAAMDAYLSDSNLAQEYDAYALKVWEKSLLGAAKENLARPDTAFAKAFKKAAARFNDGGFEDPMARLQRFALGFSQLFAEQGAVPYLTPDTAAATAEKLAATGDGGKLEEAQEAFREMANRYAPVPAAAAAKGFVHAS